MVTTLRAPVISKHSLDKIFRLRDRANSFMPLCCSNIQDDLGSIQEKIWDYLGFLPPPPPPWSSQSQNLKIALNFQNRQKESPKKQA